jgi:hypothetical protein
LPSENQEAERPLEPTNAIINKPLFSPPFRPAEPSSHHLPCCPRRRAEAGGGGGAATISAVTHPGYDPRQGIYSRRPPSPTQPLSLAADSQTPHSP